MEEQQQAEAAEGELGSKEYLDVYVFARRANPGVVQKFKDRNDPNQPVRFLALTSGPWCAIAVTELEVPEGITDETALESLPDTLATAFGNPDLGGLTTAVPIRFGPMQLRWTRPYRHIAWIGIRAEHGRADDLLDSTTPEVPGYNGSALVAGGYDLLVELGGDTFDQLKDRILETNGLDGVAWSETFFVAKHYYRGPRSEGDAAAVEAG
jgi:hypothetical protein